MKEIQKPLPGSNEAIAAGCKCPVIDNNHGAGAYEVDGKPVYWMSEDCPIHGAELFDEQL